MRKTWLVMRNEIIINVTRRSWLLTTIGIPVLVTLVLLARPLLTRSPTPSAGSSTAHGEQDTLSVEGYVDAAGWVRTIPADVQGKLLAYTDEEDARNALARGEIAAYYVIPADYVNTGDWVYVNPDFKGFEPVGQSWVMRWTLLVNLLDGDTQLAGRVWDPTDLKVTALSTERPRDVGMGWQYWIPYGTGMILYVMIIMSSSLLRESFGKERQSRVMEVLLLSLPPRQLLAGKVIGLAVVGLLQTAVWAGTALALTRFGGQALSLPADFSMPASVVVSALAFFVLGYAVYASLSAALGALAGPNRMGASTADFIIIWPLILPLFFMVFMINDPNGTLATVLSLIPFTAPVAMMTRIAAGSVPWWQPALAAALMSLTALVTIRAVARAFRGQLLLAGQPVSARRYFEVLLGKA